MDGWERSGVEGETSGHLPVEFRDRRWSRSVAVARGSCRMKDDVHEAIGRWRLELVELDGCRDVVGTCWLRLESIGGVEGCG